ncbi:MAG: SGNH/GDSL hydrolase family protein [Verrucomicrobiales bacterium]|nr:SGNH/GDSL hydrolase family protein [Verrucomicrobiales bacterium]
MLRCSWIVLALLGFSVFLALAAEPRRAPHPSVVPVADTPGLPRVLLVGDSISMGYTLPTRTLLEGKANLHRIPANGGPTSRGLPNLDRWLGQSHWDVIHFNFGIHDLKIMPDGQRQVSPADYRKNLEAIVQRLKKTGAKLIWATITPIPDHELIQQRHFGDEAEYNAIAREVIQAAGGVEIDDLNAFITPRFTELQVPNDLHYQEEGYQVLAQQVARSIEAVLPAKTSATQPEAR